MKKSIAGFLFLALIGSGLVRATQPPIAVDCSKPPEVTRPLPVDAPSNCPACDEAYSFITIDIESANRVAEEINKEQAALRALFCNTDNTPKIARPPEDCPTPRRVELSMIWAGPEAGRFKAHERAAARMGTLIDQETYYSLDEMFSIIAEKVGQPVDVTGRCGNCLSILRLTAHGDEKDSLGLRIGPAILSPQEVDANGVKPTASREVLDIMMRLRGYMCNDGLLQIYQCNAGTGEKGKQVGQAVADYMGVDVTAPDYSVSMGYCQAIPDSLNDANDPATSGWHPFRPKDKVDSHAAWTQHQARIIQNRIKLLTEKRDRLLKQLEEDRIAYRECVREQCPPPAPATPPVGVIPGGAAGTEPVKTEPARTWSVENPCPECEQHKAAAEKAYKAAAAVDAGINKLRQPIADARSQQKAVQERIARLQTEIDAIASRRDGGSAYDPQSGITTESMTQPDGRVRITVRDASGKLLEERFRERRDVARLREQLAAEERKLAEIEAKAGKLQADMNRLVAERDAHLKAAGQALAALRDCLKKRCGVAEKTACAFPPVKPVTIGPRETFGYGQSQAAAEVGKVAIGILGGFLGGRGGGGSAGGGLGGAPFPGGASGVDKPQLADDPIRDKQSFSDAQTGTAIKVGGQYRPDGKLLVSVDVDKAEDKGVVHQAALERLVPQPDGSCRTQVAEPIEWLHYEIWEDWWAKIRIQRFESVDGGPWRKTHDTGWRDWGSGSQLLESGTLPADQIPRTAWGSMGADRAFGGPRSAGALFDPGKPMRVGQAVPERLVVHVTRPGNDPVTTVPFVLYPTYGNDGKVSYGNTAPAFDNK